VLISVGLFRNASGIAVNNNHDIIVLDDVNNNIHVLRPTAFADVVHQALFYTIKDAMLKVKLIGKKSSDIMHFLT
jgi:hypothetical protein